MSNRASQEYSTENELRSTANDENDEVSFLINIIT